MRESAWSGDVVREAVLLGLGVAALLAGLAVFLQGPFDGSARRAAREKKEDLQRRLGTTQKELKSLKARKAEVRVALPQLTPSLLWDINLPCSKSCRSSAACSVTEFPLIVSLEISWIKKSNSS